MKYILQSNHGKGPIEDPYLINGPRPEEGWYPINPSFDGHDDLCELPLPQGEGFLHNQLLSFRQVLCQGCRL